MIAQLKSAILLDRRPIAIALTYVLLGNLALWWKGAPLPTGDSIWLNAFLYLTIILVWLVGKYLWMLVKTRKESAIAHSVVFLSSQLSAGYRAAPLFALLILFMPTFSALKGAIFRFNDYSWDNVFIQIDHTIHGTDPWLLLQPVFGFPVITYAISVAYQIWLLLIYAGVMIFFFRYDRPKLREQFLIMFFLGWAVAGTLLAILFASVGPCFVEPIFDVQRFAAQTAYLKSVEAHYPILVNDVQQLLLERYRNRSAELGAGITAMPSMHVALACLFWLSFRQLSKWAGWAGLLFLTLIQIGSVHLGWHYAIDGYFSIALTVLLWWLCSLWLDLSGKHGRAESLTLGPQNRFKTEYI